MAKKLKIDPDKLNKTANKMRALAHPMRIAIIEMLTPDKKKSVTQIYQHLNIVQAAASHHLSILKTTGILESRRKGKKMFYSLKIQVLTRIIECINQCP